MNEKMKDDLILKIIEDSELNISKYAIKIMLEDGILTQELPFEEYLLVYNLNDAIELNNINILSRSIFKHFDLLEKVKNNFLKYKEDINLYCNSKMELEEIEYD